MKVAARFLISVVVALAVVWLVRAYAFTVFTVPREGFPALRLKGGSRVVVNRLACDSLRREDAVVFADSISGLPAYCLGMIKLMPGDTLRLDTSRYLIPTTCCRRCGCPDCRYYLVRTARGHKLVHKHQIIGKVI